MNEDKGLRIQTVNKIIEAIASRGREFFKNKETGFVSKIIMKDGRLWFIDYYKQVPIYLHQRNGWLGRNFNNGGTLEALVKDFKHFIWTGEYSNHLNGYGGLYCPHWGYSKEDMTAIQELAKQLGYLREGKQQPNN